MHEPPESGSAPRVFVSSVVEGFHEFRETARAGVIAAGGEPVLVNEDFPSLVDSSRNVCLDAVDSCDVLVSIIGERGGWTAPSGMLVIEEEYRRACQRRIPVLVFLRAGHRDADAERFARELSDYIDGAFRRTFTTAGELRDSIERALKPLLSASWRQRMNRHPIQDYLASPLRLPYATTLRLAIAPERDDEVVDPVRMDERP